MKIETKLIITFTDKDYRAFNSACMMLDDLINGEYREAFSEIIDEKINLDEFYDTFATITNYAEEHRE